MILIKRYSNRKLYCTKSHKYVLLGDVANLVKGNIPFQVLDVKSQKDITNETLKAVAFHESSYSKEELIQMIKR